MLLQILFVHVIYAQQKVQFTQYMFNGLIINPAYAGVEEALSLTFYNRNQWVGIEGSPDTQTFSGHTLFKSKQTGLGLSVTNDQIGIHKNLNLLLSTSYHLKIKDRSYLSMGIQTGINHKGSDYSLVAGNYLNDPKLSGQTISRTFLDFGVGFFYRSPRYQLGFSIPEMMPGKIQINDTVEYKLNHAHYLLFSKYSYPLSENLDLEPGFLLKYLYGIPLSFDINVNVTIRQALSVGFSYRKSESVDFLFKTRITPQLQIGYAYDYPIGNIALISTGSHEFMINYVFSFTESNVSSPR